MKPTYGQLEKKVRNHRIAWVLAFLIAIADVIAWYGMNDEVSEIKKEAISNRKIADNWKFEYEQSVADCQSYRDANEALIKYSSPVSLNKAIKKTPLPKLVVLNG